MEAETIRDWLLTTSGRLSAKMYGPAVPVMPDDVGQVVVGVDTRDSAGRPSGKVVPIGEEEFRRSIYVQVRRSMPLGVLEPFDLPIMTPNCEQRSSSTVAPQSLLMMNSALLVSQAETLAARVLGEVGSDPAAQFRRAWMLAYSRPPAETEASAGLAFLAEQTAALQAEVAKQATNEGPADVARTALAQLCHALLISNEFLYVE
jgi:hypothetical protein